jgi:hypothetical protein
MLQLFQSCRTTCDYMRCRTNQFCFVTAVNTKSFNCKLSCHYWLQNLQLLPQKCSFVYCDVGFAVFASKNFSVTYFRFLLQHTYTIMITIIVVMLSQTAAHTPTQRLTVFTLLRILQVVKIASFSSLTYKCSQTVNL